MTLPMYGKDKSDRKQGPRCIIAVAAGKGGVGKSSTTVHLALALARAGHKVGVMDTDLYGPSLRRMLPEDHLPTQRGPSLVPAQCKGIAMISMAFFRPENEASAVRAPIANRVIQQFLTQVEWGPLDYLLIDFPPGTGDIQLTLAQGANISAALMVTTPQQVAVMDVRKAMGLFRDVQVPILGIVENMSYYQDELGNRIELFGRGGGEGLATESGVPFLGQIPVDPRISLQGDSGDSTWIAGSSVGKAFDDLSDSVQLHIKALKEQEEHQLATFSLKWRQL